MFTTFSSSVHQSVVVQQHLSLLHVHRVMSDNTFRVLVHALDLSFEMLAVAVAVDVAVAAVVFATGIVGHAEPIVLHPHNRNMLLLLLDHTRSHRRHRHRLPAEQIGPTYYGSHFQPGHNQHTHRYRLTLTELETDVVERVMTNTVHRVNVSKEARCSHQSVHIHMVIRPQRQN